MLVKDSSKIEQHVKGLAQEKAQQERQDWVVSQLAKGSVVKQNGLTIHDPDSQMGESKSPAQLEAILGCLSPNFLFEVHPTNSTKKCLYYVDQRGKSLVCVYENRVMPEFSVLCVKETWLPDPTKVTMDRADLKGDKALSKADAYALIEKHGFDGAIKELEKREVGFDKEQAGMTKILEPWNEQVRGWRTVLAYVVQQGFATPNKVERAVGGAGRKSWAAQMGKRVISPF